MNIPALTTKQMREVDYLMIEVYGISLLQMMENAGRNLADIARRLLIGSVKGKSITVLVGSGNNGGGGMVAARHLHNWGAIVGVKLAVEPNLLKDVPARQWDILQRIGIDRHEPDSKPLDLIIDALLGYGIDGPPRSAIANMIQWANDQPTPILALDTPSGLDTTSGVAYAPTIRAAVTLTLALPKLGLLVPAASEYVGKLYLADIGVPDELYTSLGLSDGPIFNRDEIILVE